MATARAQRLVAVALAAAAGLGAGCGSTTHGATTHRGTTGRAGTGSVSRPPHTEGASKTAVDVIRAWSDALRRGDVAGAARYFALPSEFVNGPGDVVMIHTEAQARAANASLPCGAVLISTTRHGRLITALFRLTERLGPNAGCGSGTGVLARTDFIIVGGRILDWIRAPDAGGGAPPGLPAPGPIPAQPPTSTGPVV